MEMKYEIPEEVDAIDPNTQEKVKIKTHMKGELVMNVPGYEESTEIAVQFSAEKTEVTDKVKMATAEDMAKKMMAVCEKYVKKVAVTAQSGKLKIDTLRDLSCFREGRAVIHDMFDCLISGFRLGNG